MSVNRVRDKNKLDSIIVTLEHRQKHRRILIYAGILVTTLVAYEPIRHNSFVSYDDNKYITENPDIKAGITSRGFVRAFQPHYFMWHPLTTLTNMLDCEFFGLNPLGHHSVNVLLHIANALLLFWILTNTTGSIWASGFAAAVFALHPLQAESVAWASERKTVLSGLFWFITIGVYIRYARRPNTGRYILLFAVYGLCIMTKPTVVTLPLVLLLLDYWPLERLKTRRSILNSIVEKIPLLAMSAFLSVMTVIAQKSGGTVASLGSIPLDCRIANMFLSYIRYIGKTIWPSGLTVIYPILDADFLKSAGALCLLLFVLISAFCVYAGRRRKYLLIGWLWFVGTLVPMIGLIQAGSQAMANRYMYISIVGLLIIAGWSIKDLIGNSRGLKITAAVSAGILVVSAIYLTRMQVRHWQNSITLFDYALKVTKNNSVAENGYGAALFDASRLDEAVPYLKKAVQINPAFSEARINLGMVLLKQRKTDEAIAYLNELIKHEPDSAAGYYFLGVASGMQKRYEDAIKYLSKTLELDPGYPDARSSMGLALLKAGRPQEAIEHLSEVQRTNPDKAAAYVNLGEAYKQSGRYEPAIRNLVRALELEPDNINALNNLAWLLATVEDESLKDGNRAIKYAERTCVLTGNKDPLMLDTLAAGYAAGGRFEDAVDTAQKAINIAKSRGQNELSLKIEGRIAFYREGKRYIEK